MKTVSNEERLDITTMRQGQDDEICECPVGGNEWLPPNIWVPMLRGTGPIWKYITIDQCMVSLVERIVRAGVFTSGVCCGHNGKNPAGRHVLVNSLMRLIPEDLMRAMPECLTRTYPCRLCKEQTARVKLPDPSGFLCFECMEGLPPMIACAKPGGGDKEPL